MLPSRMFKRMETKIKGRRREKIHRNGTNKFIIKLSSDLFNYPCTFIQLWPFCNTKEKMSEYEDVNTQRTTIIVHDVGLNIKWIFGWIM